MSDIEIPDVPLPTFESNGISCMPDISKSDSQAIAQRWLSDFSDAISFFDGTNADSILAFLHPATPFWRDMLALSWSLRTFFGTSKIHAFLIACLPSARLHDLVLNERHTSLDSPLPGLAWISAVFNFKTTVGSGTGIVRLVPFATTTGRESSAIDSVKWKAHVVYTNLDSLLKFPEKAGLHRNLVHHNNSSNFGQVNVSPKVIIIGGGMSGLALAARLKAVDVETLVIDQKERIGDSWRERYDSLCLHDPVWFDHLPYLPFPATWPVYTPASKLADWLEHYAGIMDLSVWTSSTISSLTQDSETKKWNISISRANGQKQTLAVNHVVFATGIGSPTPRIPEYPGMDTFGGTVLHAWRYKRASDYQGRTVVVIGAGTSAHDICADLYEGGTDVTMFQRSSTYVMSLEKGLNLILKPLYSETSPPTHISDCIVASFPPHMALRLNQRRTIRIAELDKDLLDGLHKVGFRTNFGPQDSGFQLLARSTKLGGYYHDTGASSLLANRKIKLKNDSQISHFEGDGIVFEDGSKLPANVVIFATGLGDTLDRVRDVLAHNADANETLLARLSNAQVWGLDDEGELIGAWRYKGLGGIDGLWYMMGNLALSRFFSSHVALQIKALETGTWDGQSYRA